MSEIKTCASHGFEAGDFITTTIDNSPWKVLFHWVFQIPLKREEYHEITSVDSETTVTINE